MNIDQYQAMVAQEKADAESAKAEQATSTEVTKEETPETPEATTDAQAQEPETTTPEVVVTPDKITIEGLGEVTLEDIKEWKNGHLRTQDYTKKTQEVARIREENKQAIELFNFVKANPKVAEVLLATNAVPQDATQALVNANPIVARQNQLEQQVYDLMLEKEIATLQSKYSDFDVLQVLNTAQEKGLTNLEDAYKLSIADKPKDQVLDVVTKQDAIDIEKLKADMKRELLKELEAERNTSSIISSNSSTQVPTASNEIQLTPQQREVALKQGLSPEEYAKWLSPNTK
jgi:hypothetical protein